MSKLNVISRLRQHALLREGVIDTKGIVVHNNFRNTAPSFRLPQFEKENVTTNNLVTLKQRPLKISPYLACIIGKTTEDVLPSHVSDKVAGFCIAARITDQMRSTTYCLGPFLSKYDMHFDKANSAILWMDNGHTVAKGTYRNMVWPLSHLISVISSNTTLYPGDMVFPGTPIQQSEQTDSVLIGLGKHEPSINIKHDKSVWSATSSSYSHRI